MPRWSSTRSPGTRPPDPGLPGGARGPFLSVLGWLVRGQRLRLAASALVWSLFLGSQQFVPYVMGQALQHGVVESHDDDRMLRWTMALAGVIVLQAVAGIVGHQLTQRCRMEAVFRTQRALVRHIALFGTELKRRSTQDDSVSVSALDAAAFGYFLESLALTCGGITAFTVGLVLLGEQSPVLGILVGVGMPVVSWCLRPLFARLEHHKDEQRERFGALVPLAGDIVMGLRDLRGIGGEAFFLSRYRTASNAVRESGLAVARSLALVDAVRALVPGLLLIGLVSVGVRLALSGDLTPGEFAALFGYIAFLTRPLQFAITGIDTIAGARVAARRLHAFLTDGAVSAAMSGTKGAHDARADAPHVLQAGSELRDPVTGITAGPGRLTGVVISGPLQFGVGGILDRLGGIPGPTGAATLGGVPLEAYDRRELRRHIQVLPHDAHLFSGDLREQLDVDGRRTDDEIWTALHTTSALDILGVDPAAAEADEPPPVRAETLRLPVTERGRSLSGGQRQRLTLARTLLTGAPIVVLDHPTSACDARTEARIARGLVRCRAGMTTLVFTTSPTLLAVCDDVVFVDAGADAEVETIRTGPHAELLDDRAYRSLVTR